MELFKIFGTIAINNQGANEGIDQTTDKAEKAHQKITAAFEKIGGAAVKAGKVVATGLAAGTAAFGALMKQSVDSYAEYEQLIGGVETLYGASYASAEEYAKKHGISLKEAEKRWEGYQGRQQAVLDNAANAYKTAGMSANEYMNTVNGFAASLTSSLGKYENYAANYADMIVTDMADNANKMGTSMEAIQNAYSGFSKQNYTMLDNLKLGYGGTQEEMKRLLRDAEKLEGYAKGSLDISSFADIAEAIHIIQENMGITGTTAKEASQTISGSIATMKSAWQNFVGGMADDNQNFDLLIENLINSVLTVADNLIPRIQVLLPRLVEGLSVLIASLTPYLPGIVESMLPGLIAGGTALVVGLAKCIPTIFPILLQTVKDSLQQIWDYIAVELLNTEASFENSLGKAKEIFNNIWGEIQAVWESIGQPIWDMIQTCADKVASVFAAKMPEVKEFVQQCFEDISAFWEENLKPCLEAIGDFIENVLAPAFEYVFGEIIGPVVDTAFDFIKDMWNNTLKPVLTGITDFLTGVFTGNWKQAFQGLVNIVQSVFSGIVTKVKYPINQVINIVNGFISGLNKLKIPDWVPSVGGKGINIPLIPKLEKGGILEKGQVGLLEGNGAEAVVPLDRNRAWINAVAQDMRDAGIGNGDSLVNYLKELLDMLKDYFPQLLAASGHDIVTNDGVIIARYAPMMNNELGKISARKDRGR